MRQGPRARKLRAALAAWVRPVVVSTTVAVAVVASAWGAWSRVAPWVADHEYFRLRTVRVASDETRVAPETLAEIAGLYDGTSLWDVDPEAASATLSDASWVKEASVSRHFPWQVSVSITRRHGVAAAVAAGKAWLVDGDGVLFREIEDGGAPDLPYLTGWDTPEAQPEQARRLRALLGVLREADGRRLDVSELHIDANGAVWLYANGIKASVRLGDASRAAQGLDRLDVALAELGNLADRARVIDTDYRDRIVIRGADDRLPALLAARDEKAAAPKDAAPAVPAQGAPTPSPAAPRRERTT